MKFHSWWYFVLCLLGNECVYRVFDISALFWHKNKKKHKEYLQNYAYIICYILFYAIHVMQSAHFLYRNSVAFTLECLMECMLYSYMYLGIIQSLDFLMLDKINISQFWPDRLESLCECIVTSSDKCEEAPILLSRLIS